jgi:hypothetical protein
MPIIPALRRLRQEDCELETSLGYIASSRPVWATWPYPLSKTSRRSRATQEAEISKISVWSQTRQTVHETLSQKKKNHKMGWWSGSKCRHWVQTPVLKKKNTKESKTPAKNYILYISWLSLYFTCVKLYKIVPITPSKACSSMLTCSMLDNYWENEYTCQSTMFVECLLRARCYIRSRRKWKVISKLD